MAEVKWIKIVTDIFDDEKVLLIENLPEADSIIVIWFKLLCLAGKQNNSGVFMLNDKIAYTDEMLSTVFRRPINTVRLALATFEQYGMIEVIDNVITIPNWEKHQSLDKLEENKEKTRLRVAKHREKQKLLAESGCNVTVTLRNATEEDIDKNREEEENTSLPPKKKAKEPKETYGELENVKLTQAEYEKLCTKYGTSKTQKAIDFLDKYIPEKKYKTESHYLTIIRWVMNAVEERETKQAKPTGIDWDNV